MTRVMGVIDFGQYDNIRQEKRLDTQLNERIIDVLKANIEQQAKEIDELREALKLRDLTDEEIEEVSKNHVDQKNCYFEKYGFARAILKKAREQ